MYMYGICMNKSLQEMLRRQCNTATTHQKGNATRLKQSFFKEKLTTSGGIRTVHTRTMKSNEVLNSQRIHNMRMCKSFEKDTHYWNACNGKYTKRCRQKDRD